ncbi:hypothetical protein ERJ75_001187300 [Trypanosoma vivax]|uniref:Uncharacterized protein n=1 Tax=Trypanosoma vivax (strain Y486) TaxID=1055687 RepID=G0UC69_TRYVY|nr:hypothetical protein TRVL_07978 [Trypanosoma vivax]KAH8609435.1 hypothetical protein ERJ75_001187300 [Trypanosoma vivax]CCC53417.1 conserved hypothetical protein [Trypanosoma vivax Y486]
MEFSGGTLSVVEVEMLVRQLKPFSVREVGTPEWKEQRVAMERLNMCSHSNAVLKKDDAVKTFLVEHEKLPILIHELLAMEAWRQCVLPHVREQVAQHPAALYMYAQYEMILVNLMECIAFHEEVVVALGEDVLELVDYSWRQASRLFAESNVNDIQQKPILNHAATGPSSLEESLRSVEWHISQGMYQRALSSLSILWFVIDRLEQLPLAASNCVLIKNDLVLGLTEIMLLQPWLRRGSGVTQKYISGEFREVSQDDILLVCTPEAHTWFSLHKMLCDPDCRRRYSYTQSKKELILRLRRFLNETIVDQIPALASVQRALEELSFLQPPSGTEEKFRSTLTIEQVPRIATAVEAEKPKDWSNVISTFGAMLLDPRVRNEDAMRLAKIFDEMFAEQQK